MRKAVVLLGSTGSIGVNALKVFRALPEFEVFGLSANRRADLLIRQMRAFCPRVAVIGDLSLYAKVKKAAPAGCRVEAGAEALEALAAHPKAPTVLNALVGFSGLMPSYAALMAGKRLCLANKESLVVGGHLLSALAKEKKQPIIPIDSEHSALLQSMLAGRIEEVRRVIVTASGGPFRNATKAAMHRATPAQALNHPNWSMGSKITIDSATLVNKAFEVIEARWLFDLAANQIEVVIHPDSIVHSLVEFRDTSVVAQLGWPDMRLPIQYALTYPERKPMSLKSLDLASRGTLTFSRPDFDRFPALRLGFDTAKKGGSRGAVFNGVNEIAVQNFLAGKIRFTQIVSLIEEALAAHRPQAHPSIEALLEIDRWAREWTLKKIEKNKARPAGSSRAHKNRKN